MCKKCETVETVKVCEGCYALAAGMDPSYWDGNDGELARIVAAHEAAGIVALCATYPESDEDHEGYPVSHFSMSPCQVCNGSLGGDRYTVEVVTR